MMELSECFFGHIAVTLLYFLWTDKKKYYAEELRELISERDYWDKGVRHG